MSFNNKIFLNILSFLILFTIFSIFVLSQAAEAIDFSGETGLNKSANISGYNTEKTEKDIPDIIGFIVQGITAFIGVIFMVLILMGSFELTSAAGNEQQVTSGKNKIKNGAIGIIIVFSAYMITNAIIYFVNQKSFIVK